METHIEIALAAALQIGALIWTVSSLHKGQDDLNGWLRSIDGKLDATSALAQTTAGKVDVIQRHTN